MPVSRRSIGSYGQVQGFRLPEWVIFLITLNFRSALTPSRLQRGKLSCLWHSWVMRPVRCLGQGCGRHSRVVLYLQVLGATGNETWNLLFLRVCIPLGVTPKLVCFQNTVWILNIWGIPLVNRWRMFKPVCDFEFGLLIRESWNPPGSLSSGYEITEVGSV